MQKLEAISFLLYNTFIQAQKRKKKGDEEFTPLSSYTMTITTHCWARGFYFSFTATLSKQKKFAYENMKRSSSSHLKQRDMYLNLLNFQNNYPVSWTINLEKGIKL